MRNHNTSAQRRNIYIYLIFIRLALEPAVEVADDDEQQLLLVLDLGWGVLTSQQEGRQLRLEVLLLQPVEEASLIGQEELEAWVPGVGGGEVLDQAGEEREGVPTPPAEVLKGDQGGDAVEVLGDFEAAGNCLQHPAWCGCPCLPAAPP